MTCKAKTKSGKRCKNTPQEGSEYCYLKSHQAKVKSEHGKCKAKTNNGKPCPFSAKKDGLCGIHSTKKKKGRKSKLDSIDYTLVEKVAKLGATDVQMADVFGVTEKTINNWKEKDEQFLQSLKKGKDIADAEVAERLFQRAMGYTHPEEKIFQSDGQIIRAETTKHYAPDTTALIFWLKNRKPEQWRDKQEMDINVKSEPWDPQKGDPKEYVQSQVARN